MQPDKVPGPDGYKAYFFQRKWDVVGPDICKSVHSFNSDRMLMEVNHTFVTLVPKSANAALFGNFRPISCCNTLYKLISKILADRLRRSLEN